MLSYMEAVGPLVTRFRMLVLSLKGYKSMTLVSLRVFRTNAMLRYLLWIAFEVIIKNTVIYFLSRILKKLELHLDWSS